MKGYSEDLAYIHDAGFGGFAAQAAPALAEILRRSGITHGLVVDLGCGSGILARELTRAGYEVLGIDQSASMIELARDKAPTARFQLASLLRAKLPPCDAVTSIGECLNYTFDPRNSKRELARLFRRVYDALRPGGLFIFDVAGPGRAPAPRKDCRAGPDWAILSQSEEDRRHAVLTRRITTFRKVGNSYRRGQETHRLRLYKSSEVARELRRVGFTVRILRGYGQLRFPGGLAGFVARKPRA